MGLLLILGIYVVITFLYTLWVKELAVIELVSVASGFFLRAYAGAVACHIYVSSWFLVVVSFGAFFLVVGKRSSELAHVGAGATRKVLAQYTAGVPPFRAHAECERGGDRVLPLGL